MATASRGACTAKITRQPNASTSGPPATSPTTGPPATTSDQKPRARDRRSGVNIRLISASELGPVAAPMVAPSTRNAISDGPDHARAVSATNTVAPTMPIRYTRRWPCRSPSFPAVVPVRATAMVGPEISQTSDSTDAPRSWAISGRLTARIVMVLDTQNAPNRTVQVTSHGRSDPLPLSAGPVGRRRNSIDHGTTASSSTPGASTATSVIGS